jgi:hypothetical protein
MRESKASLDIDERVWYDQFTSTDWVHDSIADAYRVKELRARKDIRGRIKAFFDGAQGWILSALVGFVTATIAYVVDVSEAPVYDWKDGYCSKGFLLSEKVRDFHFPRFSTISEAYKPLFFSSPALPCALVTARNPLSTLSGVTSGAIICCLSIKVPRENR